MDPSMLPKPPSFNSKSEIRSKLERQTRTFIYCLCKHMWADEGKKPGADFQKVVVSASKMLTEKV